MSDASMGGNPPPADPPAAMGAAEPAAAPQPLPPPPPAPPGVPPGKPRRLSVGLTRAVQVFFGLVALASLVLVAVLAWNWSRFEAVRSAQPGDFGGALDDFTSAEDLLGAAAGTGTLLALVLLVLLIIWMWQAHRVGDQFEPSRRRWRVGWTIGGWFIPLANLVIPKLVMNEIQRTAIAPLRDGKLKDDWQREDETLACDLWWFAWVLGVIAIRVGASMANNVDDLFIDSDLVVASYVIRMLGASAVAIGAVAGIRLVEEVRRGFEDS